jgi:cytidylate kinase
MGKPSTIAIDGPAAAGKTTLGYQLAERLGYLYFDTGVMYRAVTLVAIERGIDLDDQEAVERIADEILIDVKGPTVDDGRLATVCVDERDVTTKLRGGDIDGNVSVVASYPGVRDAMTEQQRRIASRGQVVMVGRDIGTVVLPDADLKLYLNADVEMRARRRHAEYTKQGREESYQQILERMRKRDAIDAGRQHSPMRPADDAVLVDTTTNPEDEVLGYVLALIRVN